VGATRYGISIDAVDEILPELQVTPLPRAPQGVIGIVDVRNRVVPVYDIHQRFGLVKRQSTFDSRTILVSLAEGPVALPVDGVDEVASIDPAAVQAVEVPGRSGELGYLIGVVHHRGQLVLWVDPDQLIPVAVQRTKRLARVA
jgi:chemotaxis signal transduction protein